MLGREGITAAGTRRPGAGRRLAAIPVVAILVAAATVIATTGSSPAATRSRALEEDRSGAGPALVGDRTAAASRTRVTLSSDRDDYIGAGGLYRYTPRNARITASGSRAEVHVHVAPNSGGYWDIDFQSSARRFLRRGARFANATRYPFNGRGPGLSVTGNGRGCNRLTGSFRVTAIRLRRDGRLRSFGARFVQHCEGLRPALRGSVEYRAGR